MTETAPSPRRDLLRAALAVAGLTLFYLATAPGSHTTAIDSYHFAHVLTGEPLFSADLRLFLWLTAMQVLQAASGLFVPDPDPFAVAAVAGALQTALAVVLLERLLRRHFAVSARASVLTAALFALSYGTWRYATELEVYASAAFLSLGLLSLAFALDRLHPAPGWARVLGLGTLGALATLSYQPLGIVAGFAIPAWLALRFPLRVALGYYAVSGTVLAAGLAAVHLAAPPGMPFDLQQILDTDGKGAVLPGLAAFPQAAVAALQNVLSINWVFAFGPTRTLVETAYAREFVQELVAADGAHWSVALFLLTLPLAAVLLAASLVTVLRRAPSRPVSAAEAAALVWLALHAVMAMLLHPQGFETWLPALAPATLLFGSRIAGPLAALGRGAILLALVPVFLVHNWVAGVGILASAPGDYNRLRGDVLLSLAGPGDLVVVGEDWPLERYLNHVGTAETILAVRVNGLDVPARVAEVLSAGGRVFLYDDLVAPREEALRSSPELARAREGLAPYLAGGARIPLGRGHAVEVFPLAE